MLSSVHVTLSGHSVNIQVVRLDQIIIQGPNENVCSFSNIGQKLQIAKYKY